jgi:hypothetical protein
MSKLNYFTLHEKACALRMYHEARFLSSQYANHQDREAATVALLVEALTQAGGASFLKPIKEDE